MNPLEEAARVSRCESDHCTQFLLPFPVPGINRIASYNLSLSKTRAPRSYSPVKPSSFCVPQAGAAHNLQITHRLYLSIGNGCLEDHTILEYTFSRALFQITHTSLNVPYIGQVHRIKLLKVVRLTAVR